VGRNGAAASGSDVAARDLARPARSAQEEYVLSVLCTYSGKEVRAAAQHPHRYRTYCRLTMYVRKAAGFARPAHIPR
jgi:hypothetical protein